MSWLSGGKWWLFLAIYGLAGYVPGVLDPWFGGWARSFGWRPGVATAVSVNLLLPLLAVGLALPHRRLGVALAGAVVLTLGFQTGLATAYAKGHGWGIAALIRSVPPVLVLACLGYAVLGTVSVLGLKALHPTGALPREMRAD
jgi:hypothetical protein